MGFRFQGRVEASRYIFIVMLVIALILLPLQTLVFSMPVRAESPAVTKENKIGFAAPEPIMPGDNAIKNGTLLGYAWQAVDGADHYIYESYTDEALQASHERQIVTSTTFEHPEQHNSVIWWRVKAVSATGEASDWSVVRKVTVDNEAPTIQNITEGDMSKVSGAAIFRFEVKDNYPDKIIASIDGELTPLSQTLESAILTDPLMAQTQYVTVRLAINLDTLALQDSPHVLTVRAVDHAENLSDPVHVNFSVMNTPSLKEEQKVPPVKPSEALQPIPVPQSTPIAPILGGERVETTGSVLTESVATKAEPTTVHDTAPVNAHDHPVEAPHINFGWPMWLGFGALLSGTGWWVLSGRKRL